jgi:hypothetical protein
VFFWQLWLDFFFLPGEVASDWLDFTPSSFFRLTKWRRRKSYSKSALPLKAQEKDLWKVRPTIVHVHGPPIDEWSRVVVEVTCLHLSQPIGWLWKHFWFNLRPLHWLRINSYLTLHTPMLPSRSLPTWLLKAITT